MSLLVEETHLQSAEQPPEAPGNRKKLVKMSVNLPEDDLRLLRRLADKRGISLTHVLRQAIANEAFFDEEMAAGSRILLERNGRTREVVFR